MARSLSWLIILGNPVDGFVYVGPFPTKAAATQFAEANVDPSDSWWIDVVVPAEGDE